MSAGDHLHPEQFAHLFHASSPGSRESIAKTGLRTEYDEGGGSTPVGIYMSPKPSRLSYEDVWKVDVRGMRVHPDDPGNMHEFRDVGGSYYTPHDVPPERVSLHRAGNRPSDPARPDTPWWRLVAEEKKRGISHEVDD